MIKIIIFSLLISFCHAGFAQQTKQEPTLKASVEELKASVKALGNLFKKKQPKADDSIKNTTKVKIDSGIVTTTTKEHFVSDTALNPIIIKMIGDKIAKDSKMESATLSKTGGASYVEYILNYGDGSKTRWSFSTALNKQLTGDINQDGMEDVLVKVYSNTGGNSDYLDLYIFLKTSLNNWTLALIKAASDEDLKGCKIGSIYPIRIEKNGIIIAEASCFKDGDARCCPSLKYLNSLKWENNQLKLIKKIKQ